MIPRDRDQPSAARSVRAAADFLLLALVAYSPWPFGSANSSGQLILALGVLVLVALWATHACLTRRLAYRSDPVSICLLGLVLFSAFQLVPLPGSVVRILSPTAAEWHRTLIPETPELLLAEAESSVPRRGNWIQLSVAPAATEDLLIQFLTVYLVYAATRNFVAEGRSIRRLAMVGFATGTGLAVLAITQYLSGHRETIYWRFETGGPIFGPFLNKNHFAYQIHLFAGLSIGLFLRTAQREGFRSPLALGLLGGLGLMVAAVGFSQSRGGVISLIAAAALTWIVTRLTRKSDAAAQTEKRMWLALLGGVVLIALALTAWLGWATTADRVASLWQGTADNRTPVWRRAWHLVQQFPLVGVGGGAYSITELATRTKYEGSFLSTTAHNEYLEAAIEGGIVRFALTFALAVAAVGVAVRGYRRTHDPLMLGCVFGLGAVAIHSIGDFGLHVPCIALSAAVVAAFAAAAKSPWRTGGGGSSSDYSPNDYASPPSEPASDYQDPTATTLESRTVLTDRAAFAAAGFFVFAGLIVVLGDWRVYRMEVLFRAATQSVEPAYAIRYLDAATRVRPNDPDAWDELASAHLRAAAEQTGAAYVALAGLAGGPALHDVPDLMLRSDPDGHIAAALKAARTGRDCQPLNPGPHMRLGTFADRLARTEPQSVHFDRAKRVGSAEPDVWYVCGKAAADRGDWAAALADWRESLTQVPRRLAVIGRTVAGRVPPDEFRAKGLPDDPAIWYAATPHLFSSPADPERTKWLRAIVDRCTRSEPVNVDGFIAWGSALEELREGPAAVRVWSRATERFPDNIVIRDRQSARLEAEEQYETAIPILEWLIEIRPNDSFYPLRLAAAKHALKLKAEINGR